MMKLRLSPRAVFRLTASHGYFFGYALRRRCKSSVFQSSPHLSGCKLRLTHSYYTRKRCVFLFYLYLYPCWSWPILRVIPSCPHMNRRCITSVLSNGNGFYRVCFTLRADIFLGCYSYYKLAVSRTILRYNPSKLGVGWVCR